ncbi:hypothetical protein GIB67_008668 [Kingdonia uniflora]|uniref:Uncharacterized protein n=1 Tax=Kingdonia uniflora TaxID=39325 RepID=A0A7J7M4Z7_9MAGN|nr:hypothetical protein GIB67_008668 [Kingdonia uniflora]
MNVLRFRKDKYPGYGNKRAHGNSADLPFYLGECNTYKYAEGGMGAVSLTKSNAATEAGAHIVIDAELQKAIEEEKVPGNRKVRLSASMKLLPSPISQAKGPIDRQLHIRLRKERSLLCTLTGRESIDFFPGAISLALQYNDLLDMEVREAAGNSSRERVAESTAGDATEIHERVKQVQRHFVVNDPPRRYDEGDTATTEEAKKSNHVARKVEKRQEGRQLDAHIEEQFGGGRLLACIVFRPGQCSRCDGFDGYMEQEPAYLSA